MDITPLSPLQIRDVTDRSKQHCFELFCSGNEVIKACKTDSDGKVTPVSLLAVRKSKNIPFILPMAGCGREAHCVQDVGLDGGGEGRLDQVHPVSRPSASGQIVATHCHDFSLFSFFAFAWCVA